MFLQICVEKARGQCWVALLDVQQNRLRFRKTKLSEHPSVLWLLGKGAGPGLEGPQPGILGHMCAREKEIKVTGLLLVPSPSFLLSSPFLLLFSPALPCDGVGAVGYRGVYMWLSSPNANTHSISGACCRTSEPSKPTTLRAADVHEQPSTSPPLPVAETRPTPAQDDAQRRAKIVLRRRMNGRKKGT